MADPHEGTKPHLFSMEIAAMEFTIDYPWRHDDKRFTFRLTYRAVVRGQSCVCLDRMTELGDTTVIGAENATDKWVPNASDCDRLLFMFELDFARHEQRCHDFASAAAVDMVFANQQ